jgi:hypothetical protein
VTGRQKVKAAGSLRKRALTRAIPFDDRDRWRIHWEIDVLMFRTHGLCCPKRPVDYAAVDRAWGRSVAS